MFGGGLRGGPPPEQKFRFTVGTKVKCRTGQNEWSVGVIVALNYSEPNWPPGRVVPYQVQLDKGPLIFVPKDVDMLCQKLVPPWWASSFRKSASLYSQYNPSAETLAQEAAGKKIDEPDHDGYTALMEAVSKKWPNAVVELIKMKADVNLTADRECRAIHMAANLGASGRECLKALVDAKADLDCQDEDPDYDPEFTSTTFGDRIIHRTPLHYACVEGDVPSVELLLQAKANANIQDAQFKTPLHVAMEEDQVDCIDALLKHGVQVNLGNQSTGMENTPLMTAAGAGNVDLVKKLIGAGSDLNKKGKQQMTALHFAARSRRTEVAKVLLEAKADMNQASTLGTALELARKNGGTDLLKVFGVQGDVNSGADNISSLDAAQKKALFLE